MKLKQNKFSSNSKSEKMFKNLKEPHIYSDPFKSPISRSATEDEDKNLGLQYKVDGLKKIRKAKLHSHKNALRLIKKQTAEVG